MISRVVVRGAVERWRVSWRKGYPFWEKGAWFLGERSNLSWAQPHSHFDKCKGSARRTQSRACLNYAEPQPSLAFATQMQRQSYHIYESPLLTLVVSCAFRGTFQDYYYSTFASSACFLETGRQGVQGVLGIAKRQSRAQDIT